MHRHRPAGGQHRARSQGIGPFFTGAHRQQPNRRGRISRPQHVADFLTGIEHHRLRLARGLPAGQQRGEYPLHRLTPAARQQQHRPGGIVAHRRNIPGRQKRVPHKLHRQRGVRITRRLEGKDHRHGVEIARHRETPPRLPRPDLRRDVVNNARSAAALHRQAALPERRRQPQIHPWIIDQTNRTRPVLGHPAQDLLKQRAEIGIVPQHLHDPHHRRRRKIVE